MKTNIYNLLQIKQVKVMIEGKMYTVGSHIYIKLD